MADLLATEGVPADALFGWFFGHEHRCAVYRDIHTRFNARHIEAVWFQEIDFDQNLAQPQ